MEGKRIVARGMATMDLFKKLRSGASKAADVAQQTVEVTKLSAQIATRKREIEKYKSLMGHQVYNAYQAGNLSLSEEKLGEWCKAIHGLEGEVTALEQQIKRIRNEKTCPCGKSLAADAKFCPDCGRPQVSVKASVINIDAEPAADEPIGKRDKM
jgi:polyhydroxyalkanoate synthesis regulator phasin